MSESLPDDVPSFITRYRWRIRLGTAIALVVVGTTLGASWYYFVRAPSPESVCDHIARMRRRFPDDAAALEGAVAPLAVSGQNRPVTNSTDQQCMWFFTTEHNRLDFLDYGTMARCVTWAETPQALFPCLY